ncbi:MAG: DsbA family protein [Rhodospirillales bacterium]|nr:DsbA family protein [Rhodospirillales bacterium]
MIARFRLLALAAALLLTAGAWPPAARAAQFTPAQRAEIVQIVRQAMQKDPTILRDAILALQADRAKHDAKAALAQGAAGLVTPADPVDGNAHGAVTVVEFFDVRCPYCRAMNPTVDALLKQDPNVRWVFKDLPILGPASMLGSRALLAAQKQGGYLKLRAALMAAPPDITEATIKTAATKLGLDWARLKRDMDDPAVKARLAANLKLAQTLGIDGTPALVIGHQIIPGAVDLAGLEQVVAAQAKG